MKRTVTALLTTLALTASLLGISTSTASAGSFGAQGPPHAHYTPCNPGDCNRYILANGAIIQANGERLVGSYGYVLVLCSTQFASGTWRMTTYPYGPWGNIGANHPYCNSPTYSYGPWPVKP